MNLKFMATVSYTEFRNGNMNNEKQRFKKLDENADKFGTTNIQGTWSVMRQEGQPQCLSRH